MYVYMSITRTCILRLQWLELSTCFGFKIDVQEYGLCKTLTIPKYSKPESHIHSANCSCSLIDRKQTSCNLVEFLGMQMTQLPVVNPLSKGYRGSCRPV